MVPAIATPGRSGRWDKLVGSCPQITPASPFLAFVPLCKLHLFRHPLRNLEYVKFYLLRMDTDNPSVYFVNTETHRLHGQFALALGYTADFRNEPMQGEIVYHPDVVAPDGTPGIYRYRIEIEDYSYAFEDVAYSYAVLAAAMPVLENNLAYSPMRWTSLPLYLEEKALYDASRINVLLKDDVFPDVDYIPLNLGEGYGFLRVMDPDERPNPRDVVIYEALPNDLPRVAGITSTVLQTPLSHVNLRAVQDGIPNAYIRDALDDDDIDDLIDSYVRYVVTETGYTIRAATRAEVNAHYESSRPATAQTPERDLSVTEIAPLSDVDFDDWTAFGVKAANVAVLGTLGFPPGTIPAGGTVPIGGTVPDGFAVPFYFYDEFMKHNDLYTDVEDMLADADFQNDFETQESELKKLRKKIKKGTTPAWIITALEEMHAAFPEGQSLRYRSSTNNEDLPGFSGAGLYDSKTQDPDETEEDGIDKSIKGVWESLWNFRAFIERDFHRIDHMATAMGVLVHPNYSDELANGVAVSFDPIYGQEGYYYVNTQVGEDLVTNPDALSAPEEILLKQAGDYIVLATSNQAQDGALLMSGAQRDQLRQHLTVIHDEFAELYGVNEGEQFAMEIEFKITSDNVLAIKQARPWVFNDGSTTVDAAGITLDKTALTVNEGGSATSYTVALPSKPTATVTVTITGHSGTDVSLDRTSLSFTASNWNTPQTVTVSAAQDTDAIDDSATLTHTANGAMDHTAFLTVTVDDDDNTEATGVPAILGTARVGETLTADTSGIADADGLSGATYSYQWVANDGSADADISGATDETYILTTADEVKTIKVRVSFTDDAGHDEMLTSEATVAVEPEETPEPPAAPTGLTGSVAHDAVSLSWDDPGDDSITGYQVLRRDRAVHEAGNLQVHVDDTGSAAASYLTGRWNRTRGTSIASRRATEWV